MSNKNCPFQLEKSFFFIDSRNCADVTSALYGFCMIDSVIYNRYEDLEGKHPAGEGAYVLVTASGGEVTIEQDMIGCFGLYLYQKDGYFAISNSLMYLAQRLKDQVALTVDQAYSTAFLVTDLCSHAMHDTLFQQIKWLNRAAVVRIQTGTKTLSLEYIDYRENTVAVDSAEGLALMDQWYRKWTAFLHNLAANTDNLCMDLSGGFDSRLTMALFLGAGVDLNRVFVYSIEDDLHTHSEDYRIASQIARRFGFPLNNKAHLPPTSENVVSYTLEDTMSISAYLKMGLHKQFHWRCYYHLSPLFHFTGGAGACIRSYWNQPQEQFVEEKLKHCAHYGTSDEAWLQFATKKVLNETYAHIREKYVRLGRPLSEEELTISRYRETRLTNHFGKAIAESLFGNIFELSPLIDPTLYLLTLDSPACRDKNLLVAILLDRYEPELLDFPFEGGRSIAPETIAYAREVNRRFPYEAQPLPDNPDARQQLDRLKLSAEGRTTGWNGSYQELDDIIARAYQSDPVQDTFSAYYSPVLYQRMIVDIQRRAWQPLQVGQLMLAITCAAEFADRPGVLPQGESLGAHLLHYADLPRRQRVSSLSTLPGTEYAQMLLTVVDYPDQPEGDFTADCEDHSAFITTSHALANGFLTRSTAGCTRIRFVGSHSGRIRIRLSGYQRLDSQGRDLSYPIDLHRVVYNGEVCMEGHQSVRYRRRFVMERDIVAGEPQWLEVSWLPYGIDTDCIPEPMDASMCKLDEQYRSLRKKHKRLNKQYHSLEDEHKKLEQKVRSMRRSLSWRIGRLLTLLPRTLKKLLG